MIRWYAIGGELRFPFFIARNSHSGCIFVVYKHKSIIMGKEVNLNSKPDYQGMVFGQKGSRYQSGAGSSTADEWYKAITALSATVITISQPLGQTTLTSLPIPSGVTVYGDFSAWTVVSGDILAYIG